MGEEIEFGDFKSPPPNKVTDLYWVKKEKYDSMEQQLADLKKENDELKLKLSGKTFDDEIDRLKKENERLREEKEDGFSLDQCRYLGYEAIIRDIWYQLGDDIKLLAPREREICRQVKDKVDGIMGWGGMDEDKKIDRIDSPIDSPLSKLARREKALKYYADEKNYVEGKPVLGLKKNRPNSMTAKLILDNGQTAREGLEK